MPSDIQIVEISAHIEGLLHLGALAVAVTLAYFGLDRMEKFRDPLEEAFRGAAKKARDELEAEGFAKDGKYIGPTLENGLLEDLKDICHMAELDGYERKIPKKFWLLDRGRYKWVLLFSGVLSIIFFMVLTWHSMWENMHFIASRAGADIAFFVFTLQVLLIAVVVSSAKQLETRLAKIRRAKFAKTKKKLVDILQVRVSTWYQSAQTPIAPPPPKAP